MTRDNDHWEALQAELTRLKVEIEALKGKLDIIKRESEGEDETELAIQYGGTGWEKDPAVVAARNLRSRAERAENARSDSDEALTELSAALRAEINRLTDAVKTWKVCVEQAKVTP